MDIANTLKRYRKEAKLTQKELASKTGLSIGSIQGYEQGKYYPKIENIKKISSALNVPLSCFADDMYSKNMEKGRDFLDALLRTEFYRAALLSGEERSLAFNDLLYNQDLITEIEKLEKNKDDDFILLNNYHCLNQKGKNKAIEQIELLTKIPEYRKENE